MDLWCKILLLTVHLFSLCINLLATILILKYIKHKQAGHQTLMDRVKTHYLITLSTHGAIFCLLPIGLISHEYMDYVVIQSISLLLSYSLLLLLFNILLFVVVRWVPNFPVKSKCFYCKKKSEEQVFLHVSHHHRDHVSLENLLFVLNSAEVTSADTLDVVEDILDTFLTNLLNDTDGSSSEEDLGVTQSPPVVHFRNGLQDELGGRLQV